jgi:DMSO/TMAO reductase YedYZ molybdopterin-dependent catalytic subunit
MAQPTELIPVTERPINAETPHAALREKVTPAELFYVRNHFDVPMTEARGWVLTLDGAVASPGRYTLDDLHALPTNQHLVVMECAGNGRTSLSPPIKGTPWGLGAVSQANFTGTSLRNLPNQPVLRRMRRKCSSSAPITDR